MLKCPGQDWLFPGPEASGCLLPPSAAHVRRSGSSTLAGSAWKSSLLNWKLLLMMTGAHRVIPPHPFTHHHARRSSTPPSDLGLMGLAHDRERSSLCQRRSPSWPCSRFNHFMAQTTTKLLTEIKGCSAVLIYELYESIFECQLQKLPIVINMNGTLTFGCHSEKTLESDRS